MPAVFADDFLDFRLFQSRNREWLVCLYNLSSHLKRLLVLDFRDFFESRQFR